MQKTLLALVAFAALTPSVLAQNQEATQKAIQAQYDKRSAAAAKKDVAAALAINAPEFVSVTMKGQKQTLAQIKPLLVQVFAKSKSYTVSSKVTSCKVTGDTATALVTDSVKILSLTSTVPQEIETTCEDSWIKKNNQWLRTQTKRLSEKLKQTKPAKPAK
jgi:ketosteroid isomerase-like protein